MKKITSLLLAISFLLSSCSLLKISSSSSPSDSETSSDYSSQVSSKETSSNNTNSSSDTSSSEDSSQVSSEAAFSSEASSQAVSSQVSSQSTPSSQTSSQAVSSAMISSQAVSSQAASSESVSSAGSEQASLLDFTAISTNNYYGYNQLSKTQQKVYNALAQGIEDMKTRIDFSSYQVTTDEFSVILNHYQDDYPQHFWISGNYECYYIGNYVTGIKPVYTCTAEEKAAMQEQINDIIQEILSGLYVNNTDYEIELYIHDWLVKNIDYDASISGNNIYDIYGALVKREAVCEGYAKAFQHLLRLCGIQSLMISGYSQDQNHAWNMVLLDNNFYHVDVTWDDPVSTSSSVNTIAYHNYFNLTTNQVQENHTIYQNSFAVPACTATQYNYFVVEDAVIGSLSGENQTKAIKLIKKAIAKGNDYFEFKVSGDYASFIQQYVYNGSLSPIIAQAASEAGSSVTSGYSYSRSDPTVTIYFNK